MWSIVFWFHPSPSWNLCLKVSPWIVGVHTSRHRQVVCLSFSYSSSSGTHLALNHVNRAQLMVSFSVELHALWTKISHQAIIEVKAPPLPTAPNIDFPKRPYLLLQSHGIDVSQLRACYLLAVISTPFAPKNHSFILRGLILSSFSTFYKSAFASSFLRILFCALWCTISSFAFARLLVMHSILVFLPGSLKRHVIFCTMYFAPCLL